MTRPDTPLNRFLSNALGCAALGLLAALAVKTLGTIWGFFRG